MHRQIFVYFSSLSSRPETAFLFRNMMRSDKIFFLFKKIYRSSFLVSLSNDIKEHV
ncbi:hypothetical protein AB434_0764 [Heyndrickxia coagulans]|uniref:Uncharacterized protein n=1 Tax=Heyndrickxia coagulans TaxID=1398 RepID=A0AAN0T252_HEYCO|nr:hypothetical protein SB48_HM08orf00615 [Heyndrickxia coagulans]AKN53169.1 hypothetical protein AB434_0764 [Heyndrickxia coagulans]